MNRKYAYLSGRLRQVGLNQKDVAYALHMSQQAVSQKFVGKTPWTIDEMYTVLDLCRAKPEELHILFPRGGLAA